MKNIKKYFLGQKKILRYRKHLFVLRWRVFFFSVKAFLLLAFKMLFLKIGFETFADGLKLIKKYINIIYPSSYEN